MSPSRSAAVSRRVVIATIGSLGDLHPYLAVALGLRARGHRPVVAAPALYRARVEAAGLEFAPLTRDFLLDDRTLYTRALHPRKGMEFVFRHLFIPAVAETYADLRRTIEAPDDRADLLVSNPVVFAAPLRAERLGVPWVSTLLAPLGFFSPHEPAVVPGLPAALAAGPPFLRPWWGRQLRAGAGRLSRGWTAPIATLRRELGLPPAAADPIYEGQHSPRRTLAMFSPLLGAPQPDWPAQTRQTGFAFYDGDETASADLTPDLARFLDEGPPPVVFTLGSTAVNAAGNFYAASVAAARAIGRRALLLVGREPANRASLPDPRPPGVAAFDYAPYAATFARAAAVVHQGGVGTTAQALRAGVPALVVPFNFDQPDNAARVARLGAGRVLPAGQYDAARATRALRALLDDPLTARKAREAADRLRSENGVEAACDELEAVCA